MILLYRDFPVKYNYTYHMPIFQTKQVFHLFEQSSLWLISIAIIQGKLKPMYNEPFKFLSLCIFKSSNQTIKLQTMYQAHVPLNRYNFNFQISFSRKISQSHKQSWTSREFTNSTFSTQSSSKIRLETIWIALISFAPTK